MYTIIKVLNNNTVLAKHDHEEIIVMFKGIGFGKKAGEYLEIPPQAKKYLMQKTYQSKDRFQNIIEYIDPIYLEIADEILKRAEARFSQIDHNILLPLADHIFFTMKRMKENILPSNPFHYDIQLLFPDEYEDMIRYDIRAAVYTEEMARGMSEEAVRQGKTAYFHIKIDTGMGRIGFPVNEESAETVERISHLPNVCLEGMFTHFSKADERDKTYTLEQHGKFMWMKEQMEKRNVRIRYYDCDNSAGIIDFPDMKHDLARAGISTYGMYPSDEVDKEAVDLKPALSLISHVTYVKDVEPGTAISYGGTFVAEKKMRVATIPVGYGDGYPRSLSNKGSVLIRGKRARILGRVCMDQFMVDVTEIPETRFMDQAVLVGADGDDRITVEELAELSGRFNYEFVCCLGKRIPRVYVKDGRITEA